MLGFLLRRPKLQKSLGQWGEERAGEFYQSQGWKILDRNYTNRRGKQLGEIDFVARKGDWLAFVEVKTRTSEAFGSPTDSVTTFKQGRLVRACQHYLQQHPELASCQYRIDVAAVKTDLDRRAASVTILENAVEDKE